MSASVEQNVRTIRLRDSTILRQYVRAYLFQSRRIWNHLPAFFRRLPPGRAYGRHLNALVCRYGERKQNHSTFFLRNRPELVLMHRLLDQEAPGSSVDITVVACSKGAEVYSILWALRSARPDLKISMRAVDISQEIVDFAAKGVYSLNSGDGMKGLDQERITQTGDVTWKDQPFCRDRPVSMFDRMTDEEVKAMFEVAGDQARVKPWLKEGVAWLRGDASDPIFVSVLGPQDIVVANRFLCHMEPTAAAECLRNIARLVRPGGYLFVSGVDLDVRTRVAQDLGWRPVTDMMKEVHEGDDSLTQAWPMDYWGVEPFCSNLPDWRIRFASVFQIGETS
jgi:chemotaxis methyl-accepting protein methylase